MPRGTSPSSRTSPKTTNNTMVSRNRTSVGTKSPLPTTSPVTASSASSQPVPSASDWVDAAAPFRYVKQSGLKNLRFYKYTGTDLSVLAPYYEPWWQFCVRQLPTWLAPNVVTLVGFIILLVSFALQVVTCPLLDSACAAENFGAKTYAFHAFAIFAYQTLDAIDGKQARRTKSSSALGELFDHGCDAISTVSITVTLAGVFQLGPGWWAFTLVVVGCIAFFFSAVEHYHTGWLILYYINVTEAHFLLTSLYSATAFFGPGLWTQTFTDPSGGVVANLLGFGADNQLPYWLPFVCSSLFGAVSTVIGNCQKIFGLPSVSGATFFGKILGFTPLVVHTTGAVLWARNSPVALKETPAWFLFFVGMVFAYQVGQLVVSRVCMQRPTLTQPICLFTVLGYLNKGVIDEKVLIALFSVLAVVAYGHFAGTIITSFCKQLNIHAFRIA